MNTGEKYYVAPCHNVGHDDKESALKEATDAVNSHHGCEYHIYRCVRIAVVKRNPNVDVDWCEEVAL